MASPLIPFRAGSGLLVAAVVAALAFLACFALAAALGAARLADGWTEGLAGSALVRVDTTEAEGLGPRIATVIEVLEGTEGIASTRVLPMEEVEALIEPWYGAAEMDDDLPIPALVAVELTPGAEPDPQIVQARLDGAAAGVVYDDHGRWRGQAAQAARAVRTAALVALAACAAAILAVTVLTIRSGLAAQRATIATLRLAGAEDRTIAGLYQRRFLWLALGGALLGCALAALTVVGLGASTALAQALPGLAAPEAWPLAMAGVVVAFVVIAVLAARGAVMGALRRETG